jgi:hypothetical protein
MGSELIPGNMPLGTPPTPFRGGDLLGPYGFHEQYGPGLEAIDEVIATIVAEQEEDEKIQSTIENEDEKAHDTDTVESDDLKTKSGTVTPQQSPQTDVSRKHHRGPGYDGPQPKVIDLDNFRTQTIKMQVISSPFKIQV